LLNAKRPPGLAKNRRKTVAYGHVPRVFGRVWWGNYPLLAGSAEIFQTDLVLSIGRRARAAGLKLETRASGLGFFQRPRL
jgi:hypothetical protein